MKKKIIWIVLIIMLFSSCSAQRRGVTFYSGDKNPQKIEEQMSVLQSKKREYSSLLLQLKRERDIRLRNARQIELREIYSLEAQLRRIDGRIDELNSSNQRVDGTDLLMSLARLEAEKKEKDKRLQVLYNNKSYNQFSETDQRIQEIENLLTQLNIAEDKMLIAMSSNNQLNYFEGNVRDPLAAARAYSLMTYSKQQRSATNSATGFEGIIKNELRQPIVVKIRHSNGWSGNVYLTGSSKQTIDLPFPGNYTATSYIGGRARGTAIIEVSPTKTSLFSGEEIAWFFIQPR